MFTSLTLRHVGPIAERTHPMEPKGSTSITGPSQSGKSTTVSALLALLYGDAMNIQAGAPKASVSGTTAKGTRLQVTDTGKSWSATFDDEKIASKGAWAAKIGKYAAPDGRYVVAPMLWRELAAGTAEGLRDLLSRVLPAGDVPARVRELMGDEHRDGDPADVKGALRLQTEANAAAERAVGRLDAARRSLAAAEARASAVEAPDAAAVEAARADVEAGAAWDTYDRASAAWEAHDAAVRAWQVRAPGEAPAYDAEAHQAARMHLRRLEEAAEAERTRIAAEKAAAEATARAEAEAAARAAEREAKAKQAPEVAPTAPLSLFPGIPAEPSTPVQTTTCPSCGHTWEPS